MPLARGESIGPTAGDKLFHVAWRRTPRDISCITACGRRYDYDAPPGGSSDALTCLVCVYKRAKFVDAVEMYSEAW